MTTTYSLKKTCLALGVIQALSFAPSFAASIVVDTSGESDTGCSLRNAVESINTAQNVAGCIADGTFGIGDTINFSVSAINDLETEIRISSDVLINPGGGSVTLSANPIADNPNRVVYVRSANVSIENITISGGRAPSAQDGGGIFATGSQLNLQNTVLTDNTAGDDGGGLFVNDSTLFITDSRITNNSSSDGAGIFTRDSTVIISDSIISNNTTETPTSSGDDGGGIYVRGGSVSILNTSIIENTANDEGGGIFVRQSAFTLSNSTVSGNSVGDDGGGINVDFQANASIIHSTFSNNTSGRIGGGISVSTGSLNLSNSLLVGNKAEASVLPASEINLSVVGTLNFLGRNLIGDDSNTLAQATNFSPPSSVILATSDSSQAASFTSIINPLDFIDGTTQIHTLVEGSPAIDVANTAICENSPINLRDQRGLQRTELCDLGSFELGATRFTSSFPFPPILFLLLKQEDE